MPEIITLLIFSATLIFCVVCDYSIIYALIFGFLLFFAYGLVKKIKAKDLLGASLKGVLTVKNILITFMLIGIITAVWRSSGTIAYVIYYSSRFFSPHIFYLVAFLLCCLISVLIGTSFGSAATMGVICMMISNTLGLSTVITGGAILSGVLFGDRCSPMSTSAALVCQLTKTEIYSNIKLMIKTCIVPFFITCAVYLILGFTSVEGNADADELLSVFPACYNLEFWVLIPALLIIILALFKVNVKIAMLCSILAGAVISFVLQGTPIKELLHLSVFGFFAENETLASLMDGGGLVSMLKTVAIVCISSSYSGLFKLTGLLDNIQGMLFRLSEKLTSFGAVTVGSILSSLIACNQTLAIMLTYQLTNNLSEDADEETRRRYAVTLENTVVLIAPLVPWSIACATPLNSVGAPDSSILFAVYLYAVPLWHLLVSLIKSRRKNLSEQPNKE